MNAQTHFSLDSAATYLKTLAVEIGSRPMGSPNERRAMAFAIGKFQEFGVDEAYIMPIHSAVSQVSHAPVITNTGVAVGVINGTSSRIIVIGGHIDSADPDFAGANDDGSGSAVVLELARVFALQKSQGKQNESTLVFALFGGEEQGLVGSRYFVGHFSRIDDVALMLQVDMANGSDLLVPFIDVENHSAPKWLVRAAYEEFDALGYTGLAYPTHFFTLNSAIPGGGVGSDHQPFLEREIPAIDFTSDPNDPIHTPQDHFENFIISGLQRSGDLVYKLVKRFDDGVPEEKTGQYFLYDTGFFQLFIPLWILQAATVLSFVLAITAWFALRRRFTAFRTQMGSAGEVISQKDFKIPGLKLFLLMFIIQTSVWLSENVVGVLKGIRFPWWSSLTGYFVLGFLGALVGIWLALQLAKHLRMSKNPSRYFLRAVILLTIFILILALGSVKLAFYPVSALLLLSLAVFVRQKLLRILLWFVSAHFMYHLAFSEGFELLAHALGAFPRSMFVSVIMHLFYILLFSVWSFPFLLGYAALRFDSGVDYFWLNRFRQRSGLVLAGSGFAVCAAVLIYQPTFTDLWKQKITVEQTVNLDSNTGSIALASNEYLSGTRVHFSTETGEMIDTLLSGKTTEATLHRFEVSGEPWISAERTVQETSASDTSSTVNILLKVHSLHRPFTLTVTYSSGTHTLLKPASPLSFASTEHTMTFRWYSFPDTLLTIPVSFNIANTAQVVETIEAVFIEPLVPVTVQRINSSISHRTTVSRVTGIFPQ
ncbi:MAG TPA: M28 family metallopeptidase [Bacteroidota bacterium]